MPETEVTVYTREIDPSNGSVLRIQPGSLGGDVLAPGQSSPVRVVDMFAEGARKISNVRIGVTGSDLKGRDVSDILLVSAHADLESEPYPTSGFQGVNQSGDPDDPSNVPVPQKTEGVDNESGYVALRVVGPRRPIGSGSCTLTWFFDFDLGLGTASLPEVPADVSAGAALEAEDSSSGSEPRSKRSLLVAIDSYPNPAEDLTSSANSRSLWSNLLTGTYGFPTPTTLTDSQATPSAVLAAIRSLADEAEPGDVVVVVYCGHGMEPEFDAGGDEDDVLDEGLYLYGGSLLDDDIRGALSGLKDGVHFVLVADSCFSGTISREVRSARAARGVSEEDMKEVVLAGAASWEYGYAAEFDDMPGFPVGCFSYYATKLLAMSPEVTYAQFAQDIAAYLPNAELGINQTPQVEGSSANKARLVFGGTP